MQYPVPKAKTLPLARVSGSKGAAKIQFILFAMLPVGSDLQQMGYGFFMLDVILPISIHILLQKSPSLSSILYYFCSLHQVQVMSNTEDSQDQVAREAILNLFTSLLLYHQWSEILSPSGPRHFGASVSTTCSAGTACLRVLASVLTCTISPANCLIAV